MSAHRADLPMPFPTLAVVHPSHYTKPFWDAAREHRLVIQSCAECGTKRIPPAPICRVCLSVEDTWTELPGTGRIYSHSVVNYSLTPEISGADLPYVVVVVELDGADGNKLIANLVGPGATEPEIGLPVEVAWHDVEATKTTVPRFRRSDKKA